MPKSNLITLPTDPKSIEYDRETREFRAELDGILIGYYGSYHEAERALNSSMFEQLYRDRKAA